MHKKFSFVLTNAYLQVTVQAPNLESGMLFGKEGILKWGVGEPWVSIFC